MSHVYFKPSHTKQLWYIHKSGWLYNRLVVVYTPMCYEKSSYKDKHMSTQEPLPGDVLQEWLDVAEMTYSGFSRLVPCSVSLPRLWARGLARPSYEMACRIEQMTDGSVPRTLWYPPGPKEEIINTDIEDLI